MRAIVLAYVAAVPPKRKPPLRPLAAAAISRASSSATRAPARASQSAVAAPVMPPPITTVSAVRSARSGAAPRGAGACVSRSACQCEMLPITAPLAPAGRYDLLGGSGPIHDGPLDLFDGLGDMNAPWACFRAVEDSAAAPHAGAVPQDFQSLPPAATAAIAYEAVSPPHP